MARHALARTAVAAAAHRLAELLRGHDGRVVLHDHGLRHGVGGHARARRAGRAIHAPGRRLVGILLAARVQHHRAHVAGASRRPVAPTVMRGGSPPPRTHAVAPATHAARGAGIATRRAAVTDTIRRMDERAGVDPGLVATLWEREIARYTREHPRCMELRERGRDACRTACR